MCIVCVELQKNKLTSREALRNAREMLDDIPEEHVEELLREIVKKAQEENE